MSRATTRNDSPNSKKTPAAWIVFPILAACLGSALIALTGAEWQFVLPAAGLAALAAAWWADGRVRAVVSSMSLIACSDRYAAIPERIGGGSLANIAVVAEQMRQSLIDADALPVDQRSCEAESKLHHAGRARQPPAASVRAA